MVQVLISLAAVSAILLPSPALAVRAPTSAAAPAVLGWDPGTAANVPLGGPITVYFSRPMDVATVERAWRLQPATAGRFRWHGYGLSFQPDHPLRAVAHYRLQIGSGAVDATGTPLRSPFSLRFTTGDILRVLSFTPARGTRQVGQGGLISIQMSHPMVPLAGLEGPTRNPPGWRVGINPPTPGRGQWLGTSTWLFRPDHGLRPSTHYTVTLRPGARDALGETIGRSLTWSFSTVTPAVIYRSPSAGGRYANPFGAIEVAFNQPMNPHAVASALRVRSAAGTRVFGALRWQGNRVFFQPNHPLGAGVMYSVSVGASAASAFGSGRLGHAVSWEFRAAAYPVITYVYSDSPNGPQSVRNGGSVYDGSGYLNIGLNFAAPMRLCSVARRVHVVPPVAIDSIPCGLTGTSYGINGAFRPSTSYTLTVAPGAIDAFGRRTTSGLTLHFTTTKLDPGVALYGPAGSQGSIAFSTGLAARAPEQALNVPYIHQRLLRLHGIADFLSANTQEAPLGKTVRAWTVRVPRHQNVVQNLAVPLTGSGGTQLQPGFYWLQAAAPGDVYEQTPPFSGETVVATNATLTLKIGSNETLAWVTQASDGKPAAHVAVSLVDYQGSLVARALTDAFGVAVFPAASLSGNGGVRAAYVRTPSLLAFAYEGWQPIPFVTSGPGPVKEGFGGRGPCCGSYSGYGGPSGPTGGLYLYTDRPIYRPGQVVHFKAVARYDYDGLYSRATGPIHMSANDPTGKTIAHFTLHLDRLGTAHGSFVLPRHMPLGTVGLGVHLQAPGNRRAYYTTSVEVADYRKPEYVIGVHAAQPMYLRGQSVAATAGVHYVFGQPAIGQRVHWKAYAQPDFSAPPGWAGYGFYSWNNCNNVNTAIQGPLGRAIASGVARTGPNGRVFTRFPARLHGCGGGELDTIEATTADASNEPVSSQAQTHVQPAALAIGLRPHDFFLTAGRPTSVDVVTVRNSGQTVPAVSVQTRLYSRTYTTRLQNGSYGVIWKQVPHDTLLRAQTIVTDSRGRAILHFTPSSGGIYHLVATAPDGRGNTATTAIDLYAGSAGFVNWGPANNTSLQVKPDRSSYDVGQTAHVLVSAPFSGPMTALVTIERSHIFSYRVITFHSNSPIVNVPIKLVDLPNVYIGVVIYHGWRGSSPPDWRSGEADLHVNVAPKRLTVHLSPDQARYLPGHVATYRVRVTDSRGRPVVAEVSLALVDTALLALQNEAGPSIVDAYYAESPLGVSTASDGDISIDRFPLPPGSLVASRKFALNRSAAPVAGPTFHGIAGGGGGYSAPAGAYTRQRFLDTAYWRADVRTNAAGDAVVRVRLPDNLTTWQLRARAIAGGTRVGQAHINSLATQPLLLRPELPRFLTQGDRVRLSLIVNDTLRRSAVGQVSVQATGINLSSISHAVSIPGRGERSVTWQGVVPQSKLATFTFRLRSGTAGVPGDAVRVSVPVYPPLTGETVATGGRVFAGIRQMVILPARAGTALGGLTVQLSAALTAGMGHALQQPDLQYLSDYARDGNLDLAIWIRANVAVSRVSAADAGLTARQHAALHGNVESAIAVLQANQYPDGGWPWFNMFAIQSDPVVTANVLEALLEAGHAGFAVPWGAMRRGEDYLARNLNDQYIGRDARIQALWVLAGAGRLVGPRAERIYDNAVVRYHLDASAMADLAQTLARTGHNAQAASLIARLDSLAQVSATGAHWEGALPQVYGQPAIGTTADVLAAIVRLQPHDPFAPAAARWLMAARAGSEWDCPVDTAGALSALASYARAAHEGSADYRYRVLFGARVRLEGGYTATNLRRSRVVRVPAGQLQPGRRAPLDIARIPDNGGLGTGPLYYVARLRYYLPALDIPAVSEGFSISRQYHSMGGRPLSAVRAGTPVRVVITVHTNQTLYYLKIDDPLPAGLEPIDQTLRTSQQGLNPQSRAPSNVFDLTWFTVNTSLYDDHAALAIFYLPPGTYHYSYLAQATRPGVYGVAPTHAQESFFPEVFAHGAGARLVITR